MPSEKPSIIREIGVKGIRIELVRGDIFSHGLGKKGGLFVPHNAHSPELRGHQQPFAVYRVIRDMKAKREMEEVQEKARAFEKKRMLPKMGERRKIGAQWVFSSGPGKTGAGMLLNALAAEYVYDEQIGWKPAYSRKSIENAIFKAIELAGRKGLESFGIHQIGHQIEAGAEGGMRRPNATAEFLEAVSGAVKRHAESSKKRGASKVKRVVVFFPAASGGLVGEEEYEAIREYDAGEKE